METILAVFAGIGIGFFLGEQYILYKQKKGYILPVNPFALPTKSYETKLEHNKTILKESNSADCVVEDRFSKLRDEVS